MSIDERQAGRTTGRNVIFAIVSLAHLLFSIDQTIVSTALPSIQTGIGAPLGWTVWTITIYALGQVVAKPLAGRLNDRLGPRRMFLLAITVFTVASIFCGVAVNIYMLIAMRFVQALGGGVIIPAGSAIVSHAFGKDRDRAIGLFTSILPIGAMIGPILGGVLINVWSWRGIFLVNLPIGVVLLIAGYLKLPYVETSRVTGPTDVAGIFLVTGALISAMAGITEIGDTRLAIAPVLAVGFLALSAVLATLLLRHIQGHPNPVVSPNVPVGKGFGRMNLINFLYGCTALGLATLMPLYAERRYHIPPLEAGTLLTARAVGMILISGVTTFALRRTGYRLPMLVGSLVIACGLALMAVTAPLTPVIWLAVAAAIAGLGMGMVAPASNNATLYLAPKQLAEITGLRGMFRQIGSITAVSVATAITEVSADPGVALGVTFAAFAVIVMVTQPLLKGVEDRRGAW